MIAGKFEQVEAGGWEKERKEAALRDQGLRDVLHGQEQQVCFTHISNGQGSCESQVQTLAVCAFLDILSGCCQQQLMKTFRVTVGKARAHHINPFPRLRNNACFCSIDIVLKIFLIMADSFSNTLDCYMSRTTAVAVSLGLFMTT